MIKTGRGDETIGMVMVAGLFGVCVTPVFSAIEMTLRKFDYPLLAVIPGQISGPVLDGQLMRAVKAAGGLSISTCLERLLSVLLLGILARSLVPLVLRLLRKRAKDQEAART